MKADEQSMEYKILEAAGKLFMEQGFMKTTTSQIAKEAGCNQALVHYYYRTKEQLFERIYGEKIQLLVKNVLVRKEAGTTFEERIRGMIEAHFDFIKQNPMIVVFIMRESLNQSTETFRLLIGRFRKNIQPVAASLEKELEEEIARGNIRPISVVDLILTIVSLDIFSPFLLPIVQTVLEMPKGEVDALLEHRKKEVIEVVLSRLRK